MNEIVTTTETNAMLLPPFESVYSSYYHRIKAFLYTRTNNMDIAENLTQEVFIKLYYILTTPELSCQKPSAKTLKSWIYKCAKNRFLDYVRSADHRTMSVAESTEELADNDNAVWVDDSTQDPLEAVIRNDRYRTLYHAINSLNDEQRAVIICRHIREMSILETAAFLGIEEGTVKSREFRAKRAIYRWYDKQNATALPDNLLY